METRSSKHAEPAADEAVPAVKAEMLEYFASVEESVLKKLTKLLMNPQRIQALAEDALSDKILRIDASLRQLAEGQDGLKGELDAFTREPCKAELQSLRDELAGIRARMDREFQKLWSELQTLKGKPRARNSDEPLEVRNTDWDEDDSSTRRKKGRGSRDAQSRKKRAKGSSSSKHKRRNDREHESDSDSSSSSDESDADLKDPDGDEIRVADRDCRKALNVGTYRLVDRDPERDLALKTAKVLANLRHLFDGERFDGADPLTVLPFLEELKTTFDDAGLSEGDAKHMVRYFLTGEAARLFKGLSPRDKRSYPQIVKWLLRTYVRENMLQDAREAFLTRTQKSSETELEYSKSLSDLAKRCAGMIPARDLTNRFIRGLRPAIRTQVQSRMAENTSWAVAVAIATEHGNAYREAKKEEEPRREPRFLPSHRKRDQVGRGKTLLIRHPQEDGSSDDEIELTHGKDNAIFDVRDADLIGAIRQGSTLMRRDASYASLPTSIGSSGERYYTPPPSLPEREKRERPSAVAPRKVILPPGVPYPAKQAQSPQRTSAANALPCLGCGQVGHWLSECPGVNPRLKDLALEALRARKQARRLKFDERRDPSPGRFRRVLPIEEEEEEDAPAETAEREETIDNVG